MSRPYLIIPQLIEQPTWGGHYILQLKNWEDRPELKNIKFGQSYELSGNTKLAVDITNSADQNFDFDETKMNTVSIHDVLQENEQMPLLIKLNQALGNSFQLHIKPETQSNTWLPKPESWYFLENGFISLGIKEGIKISEYKKTCEDIYEFMKSLSAKIQDKEITIENARSEAQVFINNRNPWQYVNRYPTQKYDLIDLSMGAIHHSWEENFDAAPNGNIVFEVQLDASDDAATIRSFDQGKIKDDGTIRKLNIDDYFEHLDNSPEHNTIEYMKRNQNGSELLRTRFYSVDMLEIIDSMQIKTNNSFHHLYVRDGDIDVSSGGTTVRVTKGHSCFIPSSANTYDIKSNSDKSVIIKTFI